MPPFDIINTMFKAAHDAAGYNESTSILHEKDVSNVDELFRIVKELSEDIIKHFNREKDYSSEYSFISILKYIEDNYAANDFSIQTICSYFDISPSNLSHQFKKRTGQNISDYINGLKIKYARHLLLTTDLPVDDIAKKLGYFQASSFIRKFKQTDGLTPGEFRRVNMG